MSETIAKIYFSPTGNTKKSVDAMASALDTPVQDYDLTISCDNGAAFTADDFAVIGMPVYGGRIPTVARDRLVRLKGNQTPCIVLVTYGNRHFDDALKELADLVKAQGFIVKGAAALVGRHTYGDIQTGRPDADDLAADAAFAKKAAAKTGTLPVHIPGGKPYKHGGGGGSFRPLTSEDCTLCNLCVEQCPTQAIAADCKTIDDSRCISCFRCIRICPTNAKNMDTEEYLAFAEYFSQKLKDQRENEYFL